jgi:hypothetical protein
VRSGTRATGHAHLVVDEVFADDEVLAEVVHGDSFSAVSAASARSSMIVIAALLVRTDGRKCVAGRTTTPPAAEGDYIYSEFSDDGVEYISINTHNHRKRRRPRNPGPSSL